tara:strand:- start:123 stop:407 length:285 start_codon:yes stop_codon:yes gene_type:complete
MKFNKKFFTKLSFVLKIVFIVALLYCIGYTCLFGEQYVIEPMSEESLVELGEKLGQIEEKMNTITTKMDDAEKQSKELIAQLETGNYMNEEDID